MRKTALAMTVGIIAGCGPGDQAFTERATVVGLDFIHENGMTGELYLAEIMGPGVALFDYDSDGDLDVFLPQGGSLQPPQITGSPGDQLYRNDSNNGRLAFTNVTQDARIDPGGYGMGVACGDFDNDGDVDLFRTNLGANSLLRNAGDGTFSSESMAPGVVDDPRWSVSAAVVDYDRDGWLDIYVGNYVDFTLATNKPCRSSTSARDYCSPLVYNPQADRLLQNDGSGQFTDTSGPAGIYNNVGSALGVSIGDFDGDDWLDIYVANDGMPNLLWSNRGDGRFDDVAAFAGVAVNMDGRPEASMGVDAADFDADGDEDLFMTHLNRESNTLYINDGDGYFDDRTVGLGLAASSMNYTGFGTGWFDYDNDGDLDIFSANGAVTHIQTLVNAGDSFPLHQPNQLFANQGQGTYVDISQEAGRALALSEVSRGAAFGDIDNDGDVDIVVANNNGPARLLRNDTDRSNHWMGIRVLTTGAGRDALGAKVSLYSGDKRYAVARVGTDGSYASCSDPRVLFGLGPVARAYDVEVTWLTGRSHRFRNLELNQYHTLTPP